MIPTLSVGARRIAHHAHQRVALLERWQYTLAMCTALVRGNAHRRLVAVSDAGARLTGGRDQVALDLMSLAGRMLSDIID